MNNSTRRIGVMFGALAVTALAVSGCGAAGQDDGGTQTVKMVLWPGPEGDAMQEVVDAYNAGQGKDDGVQVEMILLSRDDTFSRETTEIGSQSSELDIYFAATYNIGYFSVGLDPLDDLELNESDYFDTAIEGLTVDGQLYGLPLDISNHFLYYRTDLMDQLLNDPSWQDTYRGLSEELIGEARDPKDPAEWDIDDYYVAAAFFSQSANPDAPTPHGTALQLKTTPFNTMLFNDLVWGQGGSWGEDGQADLTAPEVERANEVYADIYESEYTSPDSAQAEYAETNAALQSGNAAFALQWSSAYAELTDPERSPEIADKIGVAPIPGDPHRTHVHSLAVGLNKYSQNKEAAKTWMEYLATPEAMSAYAEAGGIPSMPEVLASNTDINPGFDLMSEHIAEYGYTPPTFSGTFEAMTAIVETLNPAWVGVEDPDQALRKADDALQELYDE